MPNRRYRNSILPLMILAASLMLASGCSVKRLAMNRVVGMLSKGGDSRVFSGENDPELVRDAVPFTMKLYEMILERSPNRPELLMATGKLFIMYAHLFVKEDAEYLTDEMLEDKLKILSRAQHLYLRGQGYLLRAIELRHPGTIEKIECGRYDEALAVMGEEDVPYLYWCGAGWMGAFSATGFDISLMPLRSKAIPLMEKVLALDEGFENGAIHEFFLSYYGALPASMGGSGEKARYHFEKALCFSRGGRIAPYVTLARTVCVQQQDGKEFGELLSFALEFDVDRFPDSRLVNIIAQRRARWLLDHVEDFII